MKRASRRAQLYAGVVIPSLLLFPVLSNSAAAQTAPPVSDAQLKALQAQIDQLQQTVKQLQTQQAQGNANAAAANKKATEAETQAAQAKAKASQAQATASTFPIKSVGADDTWYFKHKPGKPLTFETPGGEITGYGNIDVSADATSKSVSGWFTSPANANCGATGGICTPTGNFGWMPQISTNSSYVGVKGFQRIPDNSWNFIYQLEVGFEVSATPGLKQSNSNLSDQTNGALFNRNTFIGFSNPVWGAVKAGKTDAPYKTSTAMFNPFSGELGDYSVIMGNTGGDNRVEFGTRLDHAIWYDSPTVNGWQYNVLFAPGQDRSWISDNIASGESDCTGGNDPTSGGDNPPACNDGSFSNAASANLSYKNGGFYGTAAGEWHQAVNRQSDITGMYGVGLTLPPTTPVVLPSAYSQELYNSDVADEWAVKVGALNKFATGTTVGAIVEYMHRDVPAILDFQNERTRFGTWAFLTQELDSADTVSVGWAHAFRTPGDPCQHNDCTLPTADGLAAYATNQNQADMITANYKHKFSDTLIWYTDVAATFNGPSAHFDLGAGGHGITTDCHDASDASGGALSSPNCYTGTTLVGVSTGVAYKF
ncbi:MAG: porin [Xanthobacteraceae bacterium]